MQEKGYYLLATFGLPMLVQLLWLSRTSSLNLEFGTLAEKTEDLIFIRELIDTGVIRPVIDRCYPLEQAAAAHRYVETGRKMGNVIITVGHNNKT